MPSDPAPLDYAVADRRSPDDRFQRRVVGWGALLFGGLLLIKDAITWAQFMNWLSGFGGFTFDAKLASDWIEVIPRALGQLLLIVGGAMMLGRVRGGLSSIRLGALVSIAGFTAVEIMRVANVIGPGRDTWVDYVTRVLFILEQGAVPLLLAALTYASTLRRIT